MKNSKRTSKVIVGSNGLKYNEKFNSTTMGDLVYKGKNIALDHKGRKHRIVKTTVEKFSHPFLKGLVFRTYRTKLIK